MLKKSLALSFRYDTHRFAATAKILIQIVAVLIQIVALQTGGRHGIEQREWRSADLIQLPFLHVHISHGGWRDQAARGN
jgi:hypothetical protein